MTIKKQHYTDSRHSGLDPEFIDFLRCYDAGCRIGVRHDRMKKSPFDNYDTASQARISMQILVGYGNDSGLRRNDTF